MTRTDLVLGILYGLAVWGLIALAIIVLSA